MASRRLVHVLGRSLLCWTYSEEKQPSPEPWGSLRGESTFSFERYWGDRTSVGNEGRIH